MPEEQETARTMGRGWAHSCVGVLALGLASCAVLPPQGVAGQDEAQPATRAESEIAAVLSQAECRNMAGQRAHLQAVQATLARDGMALRVLGCPQLAPAAKAAAAQQVLAVAVLVVDGERAAKTVRGPLADGELLDMGSAAPQARSGLVQRVSIQAQQVENVSPDVLHNRAWLRALMGRQGLRAVPDTWWAFAPR